MTRTRPPTRAVRGRSASAARLPSVLTDTTFEAVMVDWDGAAVLEPRADAAPARACVERLCTAGVHVIIMSGHPVGDVDGQLAARPTGPGRLLLCLGNGSEVFEVTAAGPARKHVEVGPTDTSNPARWAAAWLAARGVTGRLVLIAGDQFGPVGSVAGRDSGLLVAELARAVAVSVGVEPGGCPERVLHVGGGPARLLEILGFQLARRRDRRVPSIDPDPAWVVPLPSGPHTQRVAEALGALANGWAGSRGTVEEDAPASLPLFAVNGMYTAGPDPELLAGPRWDGLKLSAPDGDADEGARDARVGQRSGGDRTGGDRSSGNRAGDERAVDLRTGVLVRHDPSGFRTLRFVSAARPAALALRGEAPATRLDGSAGLTAPGDGGASGGPMAPGGDLAPGGPKAPGGGTEFERRSRRGVDLARVRSPSGGAITMAARGRDGVSRGRRLVELVAAWTAGQARVPAWSETVGVLEGLDGVGFDGLLAEHREAWARRWADADVGIEGDAAAQLAARFAVFHLLGAAPDEGEAAVGARGLTGRTYGGHVFWDADAFVLPALAAIRPGAARAMLEYRIRRLPAARAAAARRGRRGARYPWESAGDGTDVTPARAPGRHGRLVPVHTGERQEHIVADVAWSACRYAAWTGDNAFLTGPGRPLLLDTARYWASRIRRDRGGRAHIDDVMGPDEYHAVVDDNAYTNVLARWNLRRAADLVDETGGAGDEAATWRTLAEALVDGYDPVRGVHEQFAGYWRLEPLLAVQVAPPPVAADLVLGAKRVAGSQLIKQADVVMLHHVLPDEVEPGSLAADLAFYEPRTAHGSSLSPAIYATQLARARRPDEALALFRLAARLDLDDITGTTAGGLHLATFGGVWQALAHGFLGLRLDGATLGIDPCLPAAWDALSLRFRFLGQPVGVRAEAGRVTISCDQPLTVRIAAGPPRRCEPPGTAFPLEVTS